MIRNSYVEEIIANKRLIGMPQNIFLKLFGNPEKISDKAIYSYVVNAKCDKKKKILKDTPRMELFFIFKDNKLEYMNKLFVD